MSQPRLRGQQARETAAYAKSLGYSVEINAVGHLRCVHGKTGQVIICASKCGWHELRRDRGRLQKSAQAGDNA